MTGNYNCWTPGSISFKVVGPGGSIRRGSNNYGTPTVFWRIGKSGP